MCLANKTTPTPNAKRKNLRHHRQRWVELVCPNWMHTNRPNEMHKFDFEMIPNDVCSVNGFTLCDWFVRNKKKNNFFFCFSLVISARVKWMRTRWLRFLFLCFKCVLSCACIHRHCLASVYIRNGLIYTYRVWINFSFHLSRLGHGKMLVSIADCGCAFCHIYWVPSHSSDSMKTHNQLPSNPFRFFCGTTPAIG